MGFIINRGTNISHWLSQSPARGEEPISRDENQFVDIDVMRKNISVPVKAAAKYGYKLHCGEFGCISSCPDDIRSKWYGDIRQVCEENNIAWSNWDFRGSFGMVDRDSGDETVAFKAMMG